MNGQKKGYHSQRQDYIEYSLNGTRKQSKRIFADMFFILSKILHFLIMPLTWIAGLLCYAIFTKKNQRKAKLMISATVLLFLFSNSFLFNEAINLWEVKATDQDSLEHKPYSAVIVLGGLSFWDHHLQRIQFNRSADRILQALDVYEKGIAKRLIISGGSGSLTKPDERESVFIKEYLKIIGYRDEEIIIESASRNTYENALYTAKILDSLNLKGPYLLVTSGYHMRRSLACFRKQGIQVEPYSADRSAGERKFYPDNLFLPNASTLMAWDMLFHEWIGYITYKAAGYI
jgi:uncharacterized SAM-binding protein YcdF (DUF218 family)